MKVRLSIHELPDITIFQTSTKIGFVGSTFSPAQNTADQKLSSAQAHSIDDSIMEKNGSQQTAVDAGEVSLHQVTIEVTSLILEKRMTSAEASHKKLSDLIELQQLVKAEEEIVKLKDQLAGADKLIEARENKIAMLNETIKSFEKVNQDLEDTIWILRGKGSKEKALKCISSFFE
jgi:hypothetical protein